MTVETANGWAQSASLSIAILTGRDTPATCDVVARVCGLPQVKVTGILLDVAQPSFSRRLQNLKKNIRRNGIGYVARRFLDAFAARLDSAATAIVPAAHTNELLHKAFPDLCLNLDELASQFKIPLYRVENLNSSQAVRILQDSGPDLGIV